MRQIYLGNTLINDAFLGSDRMSDVLLGEAPGAVPFIMEVNTGITGGGTVTNTDQFRLPTFGSGYNFEINWGDGINETYSGSPGNITHTYPSIGIYDVSITGLFPRIRFDGGGDRNKLSKIKQWGTIQWITFERAYRGCNNLEITAEDVPNLSNVTNMNIAFLECNNINNSITNFNNWSMSNVITMTNMFQNSSFNQDIGNWDVSNVTSMVSMFQNSPFNQDIGNWDVSNVTGFISSLQPGGMVSMFRDATSFNQDLSGWCVEQITSRPSNFDTGATSWVLPKPNWGAPC
jgi:surface protein